MLAQSTACAAAKWLGVILALQCPADALGMDSPPAQYAVSVEHPKEMLASLPPVSTKLVPSIEPFCLMTVPVTTDDLVTKWRSLEKDIGGEVAVLARCQAQQECPPAARKLLGIVAEGLEHDGLARVGVINRAVNLDIEWTRDMTQQGAPDHWSSPLETLSTGRGDRKDYAIVKYVALLNAGLVFLRNLARKEGHAVVALRVDEEWIVLDNRWLALVRDVEVPRVIPLFVIDYTGVKEYLPEVAGIFWH